MSTDKFINGTMRTSCAALCQAIGWNAVQPSALDVLSDVFQRYIMDIARKTHHYAENCGRAEPNVDDAAVVFDEMQICVPDLEEYVAQFDPVPFPAPNPPAIPIPRESHLNHLRPGSEEVVTRPVHVHEYMPPMIFDEEQVMKKRSDKLDQSDWQLPALTHAAATSSEDKSENQHHQIEKSEEKLPPVLNGKINGMDGSNSNNNNKDESDSDSDDSIIRGSVMSPNSPKVAKSKRLESPGENPALKRVRMMLEEEGQPLREITSVMMTTSGFLTSSREGRLPDSKPPPNKDFFEPLTPPVKKKIPTMKKIIEGVKKLDKEKENHSKDIGDSGLNLFEKPDRIFSTSNAAAAAAAIATEKNAEKDGSTAEKVKEPKEKSKEKKDKSDKNKDKGDKNKSSGSKDENRDKQKLKIFKKKSMKDVAKEHVVKIKTKVEPESGMEAIESDEDFCVASSISPLEREAPPAKKRKNKDKILFPSKNKSEKKLKNKALPSGPLTVTKIAKIPKPAPEPVKIFENPDRIMPAVLTGAQKKKRGRPKKSVPPLPSYLMGGLHGIDTPSASLKPMKFRKVPPPPQDDVDFKSFVPEISINVKPPPPPDFNLMQRLPLQPGLIPAFVPPTNLKMPSPLPPSISITPATPTITPSSPAGYKDGSRNAQFQGLHSNVCSSVTITPIDMSNSQKLPTPFDSQSTPGIGSPNMPAKSAATATIVPMQSDSGITITPIVMDKQSPAAGPAPGPVDKPASGLAKLEQTLRTKEQKRKDKEKRKELKKERKKERKEKLKEKMRKEEQKDSKDKDKSIKKEKKDKSEKKKKDKNKDHREGSIPAEATVPKLTLKLQHSTTTTPVDSPNPPPSYHGDTEHVVVPPRKITIKPIEEVKQRSPSPELARFSPLVTRPTKKVPIPKKSPPAVIKTPKQEIVSFPPVSGGRGGGGGEGGVGGGGGGSKRGRGRPPKGSSTKSSGKSSSSSTQAGLITETVGSYIDEHGNKIWICPACGRQDDGSPMIGCENCDDWYHFTCVGIVEAPDERDPWFCRKCQKTPAFDHRKKARL